MKFPISSQIGTKKNKRFFFSDSARNFFSFRSCLSTWSPSSVVFSHHVLSLEEMLSELLSAVRLWKPSRHPTDHHRILRPTTRTKCVSITVARCESCDRLHQVPPLQPVSSSHLPLQQLAPPHGGRHVHDSMKPTVVAALQRIPAPAVGHCGPGGRPGVPRAMTDENSHSYVIARTFSPTQQGAPSPQLFETLIFLEILPS